MIASHITLKSCVLSFKQTQESMLPQLGRKQQQNTHGSSMKVSQQLSVHAPEEKHLHQPKDWCWVQLLNFYDSYTLGRSTDSCYLT